MNPKSLLLDSADLLSILRKVGIDRMMDELIDRIDRAIRRYDSASAQVPPRNGVHYLEPEWGLLEAMPANFGGDLTTVKLVGYHPGNPQKRGLPSVVASICVFDTTSGHLAGMMDGTLLTAFRTGAASAVASRYLALAESRTIGVIGLGAQAITQVHALSRCFPIERVIGYDCDTGAAESFSRRLGFLKTRVETVSREGLNGLLTASDILCSCTSSTPGEGPVFDDFANRPHLHINAVGSDFRGKFELPFKLLRRSLVCPDFHQQAVVEGDCQQLEEAMIGPDLRTLIQNEERFRDARNRLTVFDSTGWALEDHVGAEKVMEYAREFGLGREISFECIFPDPRDPYSFLNRDGVTDK